MLVERVRFAGSVGDIPVEMFFVGYCFQSSDTIRLLSEGYSPVFWSEESS